MPAEESLVCLGRTNHRGLGNERLSVLSLHLQTSAYRTARSWQGGWSDLFSMSLRLPLLPKEPSPSVLAPVGVQGRMACFYVVGN